MPFRRAPKWLLAVGVVAVVVLGLYAVMASVNFVTANPLYCLTCHGTGGTPDESKVSLVHPAYSEVGCVDCHVEPGHYVLVEGYRGGYAADPPRVSAACLRCHADMSSKEDTTGFKFNVLNVEVSHKAHVSERGAYCSDCHQDIAHDSRPEPTNRPQMNYCYACHETSTLCMKCHGSSIPPDPAFGIPWSEPISIGNTPPNVPHSLDGRLAACLVCHQAGSGGAPKAPVSHAGRTIDMCLACHQSVKGNATPTPTPTTPITTTPTVTLPSTTPTVTLPPITPTVTLPPTTPVGGPPGVPHTLDGRDSCRVCHDTGLMGAPKAPASHAGRTNDMCLDCHTAKTP